MEAHTHGVLHIWQILCLLHPEYNYHRSVNIDTFASPPFSTPTYLGHSSTRRQQAWQGVHAPLCMRWALNGRQGPSGWATAAGSNVARGKIVRGGGGSGTATRRVAGFDASCGGAAGGGRRVGVGRTLTAAMVPSGKTARTVQSAMGGGPRCPPPGPFKLELCFGLAAAKGLALCTFRLETLRRPFPGKGLQIGHRRLW